MFRTNEPAAGHLFNEPDESVVEAGDIQQAHGLGMESQLEPGQRLEQLIHRSESTGQRDEGVAQVDHALLALVHGFDHAEVGDPRMLDLAFHEGAGDDADHAAAGGQGAIGDRAHQAHMGAAVDEAEAIPGEERAHREGGFAVTGILPHPGTAIHTDTLETRHVGSLRPLIVRARWKLGKELLDSPPDVGDYPSEVADDVRKLGKEAPGFQRQRR